MRVSENLSEEDKKLLEGRGVVFNDGEPHFAKKEKPVPPGMMRLSSGKLVRYQPIAECLTKW